MSFRTWLVCAYVLAVLAITAWVTSRIGRPPRIKDVTPRRKALTSGDTRMSRWRDQ